MAQSVKRSWAEAWINIGIGYSINFVANLLVFPLFGYNISVQDNIIIGVIYTGISLVRQFVIRRWFNKGD
jgi:hypothetical protein